MRSTTSSAASDDQLQSALLARLGQDLTGRLDGLMAVAERLNKETLGGDARVCLRAVMEGVADMRALIETARDLNDAAAGRLTLRPMATPLRNLMDELEARWAAHAAALGRPLLVSYDGDPNSLALADPKRLNQIFNGLIARALAESGRGAVEVGLKAAPCEEGLRLVGRVRDGGSSTSLSFGAAGHSDSAGLPIDLGVGLARRLLQIMGGVIEARPNTGPGVTVVFELTAPTAERQAVDEPTDAPDKVAHVLIVDDNATNRMVVEALCDTFDCTSEQAENGQEAVEAARSGRFDLILMDIKMPLMDGLEATRAIRALPGPAGQAPILALTASASAEDIATYMAAGMQGLVEKPIKPERLLEAINLALEQREALVA